MILNLKQFIENIKEIAPLAIKHPLTMFSVFIVLIIYYFKIDSEQLISFLTSTSHNLAEILTLIISLLVLFLCGKLTIDNEKNSIFSNVQSIKDSQIKMLALINTSTTAIKNVVEVIVKVNNKIKGIPSRELALSISEAEIKHLLFKNIEYISKIIIRETRIDILREEDMKKDLNLNKSIFIKNTFDNSKGLLKKECTLLLENCIDDNKEKLISLSKSNESLDDKMLKVFLYGNNLEESLKEIIERNMLSTSFVEIEGLRDGLGNYSSDI